MKNNDVNKEKTLKEKLEIASEKLEDSIRLLESYKGKNDLLSMFILTYTFIAMQHAESIILLIKKEQYVSASSLARPLFEALIRGAWLCHKGNQDIAKEINTDTYKFDYISNMCKEMDEKIGQPNYSIVQKKNLKALHSYTHGGTHMLSRCMTEDRIGPNFSDEELGELLSSSINNMLMMIYEYSIYSKNENLREKIEKMIMD